jgi:hypothetical protein
LYQDSGEPAYRGDEPVPISDEPDYGKGYGYVKKSAAKDMEEREKKKEKESVWWSWS